MKYFTLIGNHDFISKESAGLGAAMTIFNEYKDDIDGVYIFTSPGAYKDMSEKIARKMKSFSSNKELSVYIIELDIENPVDFDLVLITSFIADLKIIVSGSSDFCGRFL